MSLEIRPAQPQDYDAIAVIHNANNEPHFHSTAIKLEHSDSRNTQGGRLVAVQNNTIVGTAEFWYWQEVQAYRIAIYASHSSLSAALLHQIEQRIETRVKRLLATIRSDFLEQSWFLETGFSQVFKSFGAELELSQFDEKQAVALELALAKKNVQILNRHEWQASNALSQLEEIQTTANKDVPGYEPIVTMHMDFTKQTLLEPFWVALQNNNCLGFLSLDGSDSQIHINTCAIKHSHRKQGIGLALTAKALAWAKAKGYTEINDGGAKSNTGHLRILERLGFEIEPDWITFEKQIAHEGIQ